MAEHFQGLEDEEEEDEEDAQPDGEEEAQGGEASEDDLRDEEDDGGDQNGSDQQDLRVRDVMSCKMLRTFCQVSIFCQVNHFLKGHKEGLPKLFQRNTGNFTQHWVYLECVNLSFHAVPWCKQH